MSMLDLNKVREEESRINNKLNFDEVMELIRDLSIIASLKHKEIMRHQLEEFSKNEQQPKGDKER